jgi:hypothetical protein
MNKKLINLGLCLMFIFFLFGCVSQEQELKSTKVQSIEKGLFLKYEYNCDKVVDHDTFNYEMQQAKIEECFEKCCDGKYCKECNAWPQGSECYKECEENKPERKCVNCDGYCWDKGFGNYLSDLIRNC